MDTKNSKRKIETLKFNILKKTIKIFQSINKTIYFINYIFSKNKKHLLFQKFQIFII